MQALVGWAQPGDSVQTDAFGRDPLRPNAARPSPYQLRTGRELGLLAGGIATLGASQLITVKVLTLDDVQRFDRQSVNAFDRRATYQFSAGADRLSDVTLVSNIVIVGALTFGAPALRSDCKTVGVMYLETMLLTNGIKQDVKNLTGRFRPFVYNPDAPTSDKLTADARESFFSGHAANAFASAVFTGEVFHRYYPASKLRPVVWAGSLSLATATAVLRYKAGKHYPSDLIVGAAFGSLVGWGIPKLHEVKNRSELGRRLDVQPWSDGRARGIYGRLLVFSR